MKKISVSLSLETKSSSFNPKPPPPDIAAKMIARQRRFKAMTMALNLLRMVHDGEKPHNIDTLMCAVEFFDGDEEDKNFITVLDKLGFKSLDSKIFLGPGMNVVKTTRSGGGVTINRYMFTEKGKS